MTWDGYYSYDGNEIINVSRTEAYLKSARVNWFREVYKNTSLPTMLGDGVYRTPLLDDAPWVDPDMIESLDFYGAFPLSITGVEDSSRTSTVVESLLEGGIPGRLRNATKSVVFSVALLGGSEASVEFGMKWLKQALLGGMCGPGPGSICNGADLCYLSSEPMLESTTTGVPQVLALLDGGGFTVLPGGTVTDGGGPGDGASDFVDGGGPESTSDSELDGGVVSGTNIVDSQVDIPEIDGGSVTAPSVDIFDGGSPYETGTVTSADVFPFGSPPDPGVDPEDCLTPLVRTLHKVEFNNGPTLSTKSRLTDGSYVWQVQFTGVAGNPYEFGAESPVIEGFLDPEVLVPWSGGVIPDGASVDLDGFIFNEDDCVVQVFEPIYDPLAPAIVPPPPPPTVPLGYFVPPLNWQRRQFTIPKQYVPAWGEVVPKVQIHARTADLRNLRLRFYADPYGLGDISNDPCAYCGDIVVSYIPQDHTLILDGSSETVYVVSPGGDRRRADSLVFKTDGTPFDWPSLSCGYGYIVTVDLPQTQPPPVVDLSLFARAV